MKKLITIKLDRGILKDERDGASRDSIDFSTGDRNLAASRDECKVR